MADDISVVGESRENPMQFFEVLCILLGTLSGAFMAWLPESTDVKRPILAVTAFSVTLGLAITFLPVIVSSPRFVSTLGITVVGAVIGFFAIVSMHARPVESSRRNSAPSSTENMGVHA